MIRGAAASASARTKWTGRRTIAVVAAVLTAELAVRQTAFGRTEFDPEFGWVHRAASEVRFSREGFGRSRWERHGVRASGTPPAAGAKTVLVLGDSFTEALQVHDQDAYTAQCEVLLRRASWPTRVVNAGHSDRSPADYVHLAPRYRGRFEPDWTVVQVTDADFEGDAWQGGKTRFFRDEQGALRVEALYTRGPSGRLGGKLYRFVVDSVALVPFGLGRLASYREGMAAEAPLFRAGDSPPSRSSAVTPRDEPIEEEVALLTRAFEGRLSLLHVAAFDPAAPSVPTETEERLLAAAGRQGVEVASTRGAYAGLASRGRAPFGFPNSGFNEGHLNAEGHRIAAESLATQLRGLRKSGLL